MSDKNDNKVIHAFKGFNRDDTKFALMVEWPNGAKGWFHVSAKMLQLIQKRLARMEASNGN